MYVYFKLDVIVIVVVVVVVTVTMRASLNHDVELSACVAYLKLILLAVMTLVTPRRL